MMTHIPRIVAVAATIILITLLPFMPGSYDPLATSLSTMARVAGLVGLLLMPIGILWTASSYWFRDARWQNGCAVAAFIVWSLISAVLSMAAFALSGWSLGVAAATLSAVVIVKLKRRTATFRAAPSGSASAVGLYLSIVPLTVFLFQHALLGRAVEFSRDRAIRNAAPLIADIERHRAERHQYPLSLLSVNQDYLPSVIGIERFHYEPSGDAFNLLFEQPSIVWGTREYVVYNPRDEQVATSHAMDILQYSPDHLQRARGYYAVQAARQAHWKLFWFD